MKIALLSDLDEDEARQVAQWIEQSNNEITRVSVDAGAPDHGNAVALILTSGRGHVRGAAVRSFIEAAGRLDQPTVMVSVGDESRFEILGATEHLVIPQVSLDELRTLESALATAVGQHLGAPPNEDDAEQLEQAEGAAHQTSVFLSYRRADGPMMNKVRIELEERGYRVWWDKDKAAIPPAVFWPSSVEEGVAHSDAFVALISPRVLESPKRMQAEIYLADNANKKMVALFLAPVRTLPKGWNFIFAGQQRIELYHDFSLGIEALCTFLGPTRKDDDAERGGLRQKIRSGRKQLARLARDPDFRRKAKTVTLSVAAALATAVAATASSKSNQATSDRKKYIRETLEELDRAFEEIRFGRQLDPEFQLRFQRLIGNLEKASPPPDLAIRHSKLVSDLDKLGDEYNALIQRLSAEDAPGVEFAIERLNNRWSRVLQSNTAWLRSVLKLPDPK